MEKKMFHEGLVLETEQGPFLIGKKCPQCGYIQFPNGKICEKCLCDTLEDMPVGQRGKIFSYTTTYGRVSKMRSPFACGYIELPEGLRVFAPLRMEEGRDFEIGQDVELEIAELWEETETQEDGTETPVSVTGYQYRIAGGAT